MKLKDLNMINLLVTLEEISGQSPTKEECFQHSVVLIPSFYFEITENVSVYNFDYYEN